LAVGATGSAMTAGCVTDVFGSTSAQPVLPKPEGRRADSEDIAYPAHGQAFPAFELPDATSDAVIDTGALDGVAIITTYFASCPAECGVLLTHLADTQREIIARGLADDVSFLPITFDPARDDAEKIRRNAERRRVDLDAGNWYNLRPETPERAHSIVTDQLGIKYVRAEDSNRVAGYDFTHIVVTWLVNPDGIVERAYRGEFIDTQQVLDDIETVLEARGTTATEAT
jgi:protein SCO1/2